MSDNEQARYPEGYVPRTALETRRARLRQIWDGLERMGNLKQAHCADATVRRDGDDHHFGLDWLKYVEDFLPRPENLEGDTVVRPRDVDAVRLYWMGRWKRHLDARMEPGGYGTEEHIRETIKAGVRRRAAREENGT